MNWKKALLITVFALFALVFFTVAAVGCAATAAVTAAAAAIDDGRAAGVLDRLVTVSREQASA